ACPLVVSHMVMESALWPFRCDRGTPPRGSSRARSAQGPHRVARPVCRSRSTVEEKSLEREVSKKGTRARHAAHITRPRSSGDAMQIDVRSLRGRGGQKASSGSSRVYKTFRVYQRVS